MAKLICSLTDEKISFVVYRQQGHDGILSRLLVFAKVMLVIKSLCCCSLLPYNFLVSRRLAASSAGVVMLVRATTPSQGNEAVADEFCFPRPEVFEVIETCDSGLLILLVRLLLVFASSPSVLRSCKSCCDAFFLLEESSGISLLPAAVAEAKCPVPTRANRTRRRPALPLSNTTEDVAPNRPVNVIDNGQGTRRRYRRTDFESSIVSDD